MTSTYLIFHLLLIVSFAATSAFACFAFMKRDHPGAMTFAALMIQLAIWALFAEFILIVPDLDTKMWLTRGRLLGIVFLGPTLFYLNSTLHGRGRFFQHLWVRPLFFLPSLVFLALAWAPGTRELYLTGFELVTDLGGSTARFYRGPIVQVQLVWNYLLVGAAMYFPLSVVFRNQGLQRKQAIWIILGSLVPYSADWLAMSQGWVAHWYHLTPGMSCFMAVFFSVAIFRYQLLGWKPLAQSQVFERIPDPILALDRDRRLMVYNHAAAKVFNLSTPSIGKTPGQIMDGVRQSSAILDKNLSELNEAHAKKTFDMDLPSASGELHSYIVRAERVPAPLADEYGLLVSFHDISHRQKLEAEIRDQSVMLSVANTRLEQLLQMRDRLLSLVAHDLAANIGSMVMVSSVLVEKTTAKLDEQNQQMLRLLVRSAVTLQEFFQNMLQWLGRQGDRFEPSFVICEMNALIGQSISQLTPMVLAQQIRVEFSNRPNILVPADPDMISAVIRNLVSNAIQASKAGSVVLIELFEDPIHVRITVADVGEGIGPERLKRLLTQTSTGIRDEESRGSGFGIGLQLCREFVQHHGGRLTAESELGRGSRFSIEIPKKIQSTSLLT